MKVQKKTQNVEPEQVINRLLNSKNPCDQRKGHDLGSVLGLSKACWHRQFCILGFCPGADGSLGVICCLQVRGLVWGNEIPVMRDTFEFVLGVPQNYPLILPTVQFVRLIPYNPHIVHPSFMPNTVGLPAELQEYARQGAGYCCFLRHTQWSMDLSCNLALVIWQVSRILSLNKVFGEAGSLNKAARDYVIQLQKTGGLPLGPALPLPDGSVGQNVSDSEVSDEQQDDIIWLTETSEGS